MNAIGINLRLQLPGATLVDRVFCSLGALLGIALTALSGYLSFGSGQHLPYLVAPLGASAVLIFAVPASPLAQPWSVIGGNTVGALIGITAAQHIGDPFLACGAAVAAAIALMSLLRCLHPPGGAAALTAVLGGSPIAMAGYKFAFIPVAANSVALVVCGMLFHRLTRHRYPHRVSAAKLNVHGTQDPPAAMRVGFTSADIDDALAEMGETLDIERADLDDLLQRVELRALARQHHHPRCGEIMSRDLVVVSKDARVAEARALMLKHAVRTLPVVDSERRLCGVITLRQLHDEEPVSAVMLSSLVAEPSDDAVALIPKLADGHRHAVVVIDADRRPLGMITQTDLLACLSRVSAASADPTAIAAA